MCRSRRHALVAAAAGIAGIVSAVSGFAQTNNSVRAMTAFERSAAGALQRYSPERSVTPVTAVSLALPPNLVASSTYRPLLLQMLQRSATFRRQCQRIANTSDLVVTLRTPAAPGPTRIRARAHIVKDGAQMHAAIEVIALHDPAELIAHELEHVIEQLDGVDLAAKAVVATSGVADESDGYETARAKRVGLAVAAEVRRGGN
jgi:hypothetical protein